MNTDIKAETISEKKRVLVFVLESKNFGIELTKIREITDILPSARLPGARDYVQGLGNLRGEVIPIISLRKRLNMVGKERGKQLIIVIGEKVNYGLRVDRISGIYNVETDASKSISSIFSKDIETSFLKGVSSVSGIDVILLDCEKIIENNE
jgi:purine-binding chemotaxis protein CheW